MLFPLVLVHLFAASLEDGDGVHRGERRERAHERGGWRGPVVCDELVQRAGCYRGCDGEWREGQRAVLRVEAELCDLADRKGP